jgi:Coenzyme PQQ synthesis protein D (PqqD)
VSELRLRQEGVAWKDVDGEVVALDERAAVYLGVNPAGALLWRSLAAGATRAELVAELAGAFGIASERAAADTDAFLADLGARGLLLTAA